MQKLYATRGLPASGKSTWAREFAKSNPDTVVVTKDDIRLEVVQGEWTPEQERLVHERQEQLVREAIAAGHSVIIADTNLNPRTMNWNRSIAAELQVGFQVVDFDTPYAECIERDSRRPERERVGEEVIMRMYRQFVEPRSLNV